MNRPKYLRQIAEKITDAKTETIFVPPDFYSIAEPATVNACLKRLADSGVINRIMRGLYVKPNNKMPYTDDVAQAIARINRWTIIPSGKTALYISGISWKKPSDWTYVSDGAYRKYNVNGKTIIFVHSDNKRELSEVTYKTALIIQVLRATGKDNITKNIINKLAKKIMIIEKTKMQFESQRITSWIKNYLLEICYDSGKYIKPGRTVKKKDHKDKITTTTFFGTEVSSKSEALIATALFMAGINFVYEQLLYDKSGSCYKPDFTIKYKGRKFYWEHVGMLDNKGYAKEWAIKEKWYNANFPGQLIVTNDQTDIGAQIKQLLRDKFNYNGGK